MFYATDKAMLAIDIFWLRGVTLRTNFKNALWSISAVTGQFVYSAMRQAWGRI